MKMIIIFRKVPYAKPSHPTNLDKLRSTARIARPAWYALVIMAFLLPACAAGSRGAASPAGKLKIVATTTIVGDVVRSVGGENLDLNVLLPVGSDPHSFEPVPQDLARLTDADLVFANGAGLEEFLSRILKNASGDAAGDHPSLTVSS